MVYLLKVMRMKINRQKSHTWMNIYNGKRYKPAKMDAKKRKAQAKVQDQLTAI